jgi:hypothetical protein
MTSVSVVNNQKDNRARNFVVGAGAAVIGYEAEPYIKNAVIYPVRKKFASEIKTIQGGGFKPYIEKALKQNGLENKLNVDDGILGDNVDCVLYEGYIDEYSSKAIFKGKIIVRPFKNQRMFVQYKSAFGHGDVEPYKLYEMPSEFECWTFDVVIQGRATNVYDVEVQYEYENENGVNVFYVDDNFGRRYKIYKEGIYDNM